MGKKKKKPRIRPLALCLFRRDNKIFVSQGYDSLTDETFFRPIGGKIEFGERGHETVVREVLEEIKAEVTDIRYIGTLENLFEYEGKPGHEIVLIYDGRFVDEHMNDDNIIVQGEDNNQLLFKAMWKPLDFFRESDAPPLYPAGLLDLLDKVET